MRDWQTMLADVPDQSSSPPPTESWMSRQHSAQRLIEASSTHTTSGRRDRPLTFGALEVGGRRDGRVVLAEGHQAV